MLERDKVPGGLMRCLHRGEFVVDVGRKELYNRLAKGIPLQLDTTVLYALQRTDPPPSSAELKINSPYNTYRIAGLPPGPINSPGEQAISAVLAPAPGPWLYYVTVDLKTGETKFTDSYKEFLTFKAELKANSK